MTSDHGPDAFRGARHTAAAWTRRIRIVLGIAILLFSIALLIWGLLPAQPEIRTQPISPAELQLPTPTSLHFDMTAHMRDSPAPAPGAGVTIPLSMREGIAYGISHIAIRDPR
ncbi:MAG: hypothetical protein EHM33_32740 [Chloroflexi bacterium]|nr:MAG: hypothetical protein EHM33_32740 [Chloroflexota bacterium]